VAVHLISLCVLLEERATPEFALRVIRGAVSQRFEWLHPPSALGLTTVADVHGASDAEDHAQRVRAWAEDAWSAWSPHHQTIRSWLREAV
jgi:hypothetical protein